MFQGIYTALITPFDKNGTIDMSCFHALLESQIQSGVQGVVVGGTTGEAPTLSEKEFLNLLSVAISQCKGSCQVLAGVGSNATHKVIQLAHHAESCGVDGLMVVSPYYNKPSHAGLFKHFSAIHQQTSTPIMLYNHPGRTGVDLTDDTVLALFQLPRIVSLKDATGDLSRYLSLAPKIPQSKTILTGVDGIMLPFLTSGGDGVVSVISNALPKETVSVFHAVQKGELPNAKTLHAQLHPFLEALEADINPVPIKSLLHLMKRASPYVRLPLVPASQEVEAGLQQALNGMLVTEERYG